MRKEKSKGHEDQPSRLGMSVNCDHDVEKREANLCSQNNRLHLQVLLHNGG